MPCLSSAKITTARMPRQNLQARLVYHRMPVGCARGLMLLMVLIVALKYINSGFDVLTNISPVTAAKPLEICEGEY